MTSKSCKTCDPQRIFLNLPDEANLRTSEKYVALSNLASYDTWNNNKRSCVNSKFKISFPKWNDKSELPDGSYSLYDIQDYFEYIIKKHNTVTDDPRIRIYIKISKTKSHLISK